MSDSLRLYDTIVKVLNQHRKWLDIRHLTTLAWMVIGLIQSGSINLTAWAVFVVSRATQAQSTVRRFQRWLNNERIDISKLYSPFISEALSEWKENTLFLALDTSMLFNKYCLVRIAAIYRGRSVPIVWKVLEHPSSSVRLEDYEDLLDELARILPAGCKVKFLADRGFADTKLMARLSKMGWDWYIRIKRNIRIYRRGRWIKGNEITLAPGQAQFLHNIFITDKCYGPVHLAVGRPLNSKEYWLILSNKPTDFESFKTYSLRFCIEESFLDDKSNGFQLESSEICSAEALERLCFVLAVATLFLVSQGVQVVKEGKRKWVDPHWFRGASYLKIGWKWIKYALTRGLEIIPRLKLCPQADPEPAIASKKQLKKPPECFDFKEGQIYQYAA